tara:strand:- start:4838 stop:5614 length:777 start_codon:yes stop_codon:yes gene_type:complete
MHKHVITKTALFVALSIACMSAFAQPNYARQFKQQYGFSPSCQACHSEGGGTKLNNYGEAFKEHGKNLATFKKIATLDSDLDGTNNEEEALAKSNPGDKHSTPANKGQWLDLSSLIPKVVQARFPDATAWKPLDVMLTQKDIDKARSLGVTLSPDDENTIYIPVADRRPIGTAIIFPVEHSGATFFLLMTSDRQLNFSEVSILKVGKAPDMPKDPLFESWLDQPIQSLDSKSDKTLAGSISRAVKKTGVLVYLRLKGA